jgi:hypothetical protein
MAEAGTVLVSPTMVAPWDEVSATLKPAFALTGDQAASQVIPTTESISQQVLDAFGASLAVGLPTTATSSKTVVGGSSPGTTTTTQTNPGTAPTVANTIPAGATLPAAPTSAATLGLDPVLKYKAANYLLQEVQLLNQEIDNAANRSCYLPYVVKLKLAVMNFRPLLPYSVHMHIGFLYNGALASNTRLPRAAAQLPLGNPELAPECQLTHAALPVVVPMLVADDVQAALNSRAAEAASQIAFGVSALVQGAGIAANAGSFKQSLTAITNHDLSSTLTVGREAENSLYALITPNNQASNQASLVSQTYDVAVLLLVPRAYFGGVVDPQSPTIAVATFSEYRDAKTGVILTDNAQSAMLEQAKRVLPRYLSNEGKTAWYRMAADEQANEVKRLADTVKAAAPEKFWERVNCTLSKPEVPTQFCGCPHPDATQTGKTSLTCFTGTRASLWTELSSFLDYDVDKLSLFQARLPTAVQVPSQQIVLNDDGNNPLQAVLGGVSGRSIAKIGAFMEVTPFDVKAWNSKAPVTIPAQALTLDTTAHTLTATFPSLKKLNITCLTPAVIPAKPPAPKLPKPPVPKPPAGSGAAAKPESPEPKDPDCPVRGADAGTPQHPNAIVFQLVGCDPSKVLCPALTDTSITAEDKSRWLTKYASQVSIMQRLLAVQGAAIQAEKTQTDEEAQLRAEKLVALDLQAKNVADVLGKMEEASETLAGAPDSVISARWRDLRSSIVTARLDGYIEDRATIGVSLFASQQSTATAKVDFANFGPNVSYDSSGVGQLIVTLTPTPASDTIGVTVDGASLKDVLDSTGAAVPFNAKHGFVLPQAGVYTFELTNLKANQHVTVTAQALKGDAADGQPAKKDFSPIAPVVQKPTQDTSVKPNKAQ